MGMEVIAPLLKAVHALVLKVQSVLSISRTVEAGYIADLVRERKRPKDLVITSWG
jgi:hypothetical protein